MATEIRVPTLGESVTEATVAKWFKQVGDNVAADEPLLELETDKVTVEVPSPAAGTLGQIDVDEGTDVEVGALLGAIVDSAVAAVAAPAASGNGAASPAGPEPAMPTAVPAPAAPAPAAGSGAGIVDVVIPELGESVTEGTVAKWLKKVGETVVADEPLAEIETEKVTAELPSPVAGALTEILVEEGTDVEVGAVIGRIAAGAAASMVAATPVQPKPAVPPVAPAPPAPVAAPATQSAAVASGPLAPSVRKLVDEHGLDPAQIPASGRDGRLTKGDVLTFMARPAPAAAPAPSATPRMTSSAPLPPREPDPRGEERVRMTKLRRTIAARLKEAQNTAAMLTTFNEVDMGAVMGLRAQYRDAFEKKHGVRLGFMSFFVKAAVGALRELPAVNAEVYGDEFIYKNFYDIGIAVGSPMGLVVPVLRDADKQSFDGIERAINDFGKRARDGKLSMADLTGGTFTITNGGIFGSLLSTPIINPPQSAILGMHKIQKRPMAVGDKVEARPMMYLALSYDHRIIDGREAVTCLVRIKDAIEDPQRLMLNV